MRNSRLLIVDDDVTFATVLGRALEKHGYDVRVQHTADDALASIQSTNFHFVLLDLMLGNTSGIQLIEPIKAANATTKIIMLTGFASIPTTVRALKLGASNYIAKPVGTYEVVAALNDVDEVIGDSKPMSLRRLEWEHLQRVLADHGGNISQAAKSLKMHRRTLQRKLLKRPSSKS